MSAKSKKLRSRFVKAKAPATRSHLVKAKQSTIRSHLVKAKTPTIRSHFVKAKTPTIRRHFVKAKTPTIRRHFVKAEQPTIRSHFVKAEQPTIRSHFVKAKKSQTDNHVVKTNKSPMKNKMSLARLKRLRHARPILAGHGGRKQLMGGSMYPEEEEEGALQTAERGVSKVLEGTAGAKSNPLNEYKLNGKIGHSTKLGIQHRRSGKWVMRMDSPHGSMKHSHININEFFTKLRDPHLKISKGLYKLGAFLGKGVTLLDKHALKGAIVFDTARLYNVLADKTLTLASKKEMIASVIGGYVGAYGGPPLLTGMSALAGQGLGMLIGGRFILPLRALGSILGSVGGGILGSILGAELFVEIINNKQLETAVSNYWHSIHQRRRH